MRSVLSRPQGLLKIKGTADPPPPRPFPRDSLVYHQRLESTLPAVPRQGKLENRAAPAAEGPPGSGGVGGSRWDLGRGLGKRRGGANKPGGVQAEGGAGRFCWAGPDRA